MQRIRDYFKGRDSKDFDAIELFDELYVRKMYALIILHSIT